MRIYVWNMTTGDEDIYTCESKEELLEDWEHLTTLMDGDGNFREIWRTEMYHTTQGYITAIASVEELNF